MITQSQAKAAQERAADMLAQTGIQLTVEERDNIEIAEFGLGELERTRLSLNRANSSPFHPIRCIGSRRVMRAQLCLSFPLPAAMNQIFLRIRAFSGCRRLQKSKP